jgi:hypothetical protein
MKKKKKSIKKVVIVKSNDFLYKNYSKPIKKLNFFIAINRVEGISISDVKNIYDEFKVPEKYRIQLLMLADLKGL